MSQLSIDQLLFDPSDIAQGPKVGSYLLDGSGNLLTSGGVASDNISASGIQALDARAFLLAWDSGGSNWDRLTLTSGALNVNVSSFSGSLQVQGITADDAVDADNPVKIGFKATNAALTALSATGDRADAISDLYRRMYINDSPNIACASSAKTVGVAAAQLDSTPLAGRRRVIIQNNGTKNIYVGPTGVTVGSGLKIAANASLALEIGENVPLYAISGTAGQTAILFELA